MSIKPTDPSTGLPYNYYPYNYLGFPYHVPLMALVVDNFGNLVDTPLDMWKYNIDSNRIWQ